MRAVRHLRIMYVLPSVAMLSIATWPLINGSKTLFLRDVLSSHFPLKAAGARLGLLSLLDPFRAGGQPFLGNPNALPIYPDNVLYQLAHPLWALNAHFWIHLLLAPFTMYWLGRSFGLSRPASWASGVAFAGSGYFLSLMNLYNLIAGAALTPAFIASCRQVLEAASRDSRESSRRVAGKIAVASFLWALLLLAGDPFYALLAGVLALGACWTTPLGGLSRLLRLTALGGLGTLMAAPMLIETIRVLPLSYRGYWQYSTAAALSQSWDPRSILELLIPFAFGTPDFLFWGKDFYGGNPPLFFSLYPGLLIVALVCSSGRGRSFPRIWAWSTIVGGVFLALGAWNPLARLLYSLPGLRYPVKCWLLIAIGLSMLAGIGFERLVRGRSKPLSQALLLLCSLYFSAWAVLTFSPETALRRLLAFGPNFPFEAEVVRWAGLCLLSWILVGVYYLLVRRGGTHAPPSLLLVHLGSQLFFLQPLIASDDSRPYRTRPAALEALPAAATVVHGQSQDLFGAVRIQPLQIFPDARYHWAARSFFEHLHPFSGIQWGLRYEFNHSPEGLDSFFTISLRRALEGMTDPARLRLLAASGVDTLLLARDLDPSSASLASLRTRLAPELGPDLRIYDILRPAPKVQLVTGVRFAGNMNEALDLLTGQDFDPWSAVVLPGNNEPLLPRAVEPSHREVTITRDEWPNLDLEIASESGGVVVIQRTFHAYYRATVDDQPTPVEVANAHRLGIRVGPGKRTLKLTLDTRPTTLACGLALIACFATFSLLVASFGYGRRRRS